MGCVPNGGSDDTGPVAAQGRLGIWFLRSRVVVFSQGLDVTDTEEARMTTQAQSEDATTPWWLVLLEGLFVVIFGILIITAPGTTLVFLVQVFGFYLLIGGILRIVSIFVGSSSWGWKLVGGILGILAGIVVLNHPLWSTVLVPLYAVYIIGFLSIVEGIFEFIAAFQGDGWGIGLLGILRIVFGIILVINPLIGVVALPFVLGAVMLAGGIAAIVVSFRMRSNSATTEAYFL
jgi:uncharacterized membrane protein HdeD (DUF308 family)